ncbi:MAG: cyclic nucleotide-binding domain-containing protein [Magnetococcales bacterium]|nr:cyclic nucleotide-binding domain-containing protein [Magnetococcales bacterium]
MSLTPTPVGKSQRWDNPFSAELSEGDVARILQAPPFRGMDAASFPAGMPLERLARNDTRLVRFRRGDLVMRAGDYGHSAFVVLSGRVRVILRPGLPEAWLGRTRPKRKGLGGVLRQLWLGERPPECREVSRLSDPQDLTTRFEGDGAAVRVSIPRPESIFASHETVSFGPDELFGEIGALGRFPRSTSVICEEDAELLEIRWQGLRDLRRFDARFRRTLDELYRSRSLSYFLRHHPLFARLDDAVIRQLETYATFESFGALEAAPGGNDLPERERRDRVVREPLIAEEGAPADQLILVQAGFARISRRFNHGHKTVGFLGPGRGFGLPELKRAMLTGQIPRHQVSLRAMENLHVVRLAVEGCQRLLKPEDVTPPPEKRGFLASWSGPRTIPAMEDALLEFLVEHRFNNGSATMMVDLERCVRCDDCVRACATAHGGNPRFVRHGRRHDTLMVATACMHCIDPVCTIGCPTGAIHRHSAGGQVIVNEAACIGCATCADSCPYEAIRMVEVRDAAGQPYVDSGGPVRKATKCDLCVDQWGGPACERACPGNALLRADMQDTRRLRRWLRP